MVCTGQFPMTADQELKTVLRSSSSVCTFIFGASFAELRSARNNNQHIPGQRKTLNPKLP